MRSKSGVREKTPGGPLQLLLGHRQSEDGVDEIVEAVVRHLQADVGAVKRRRPLQMGHLVEVSTYERDHLQGPRGRWEVNLSSSSAGKEFQQSVTLTLTSFFSRALPSGNFSPKHMLMMYSGDPPLFSLNSFSSAHGRGRQRQQTNK